MKRIAKCIILSAILIIAVFSFGCSSLDSENATNNTNEYICVQEFLKSYNENGEEWSYKYVNHYNNLGFQDSQILYLESKNQDFFHYSIANIKCDSKGNIIHYCEPGIYNIDAYYDNEYDDNDKLVKTLITCTDDSYVDTIEYEYDEKDFLEREIYLNNDSVYSVVEEHEYDNYGNLTKCITRYSDGGYCITEYEYMKLDEYLKMVKNEKLELKGTWVNTEDLLSDEEDKECRVLSFDGVQVKKYLGIVDGKDITPVGDITSYDYNVYNNEDNGKRIEYRKGSNSNSFYNDYAISSDGEQKHLYIGNEGDFSSDEDYCYLVCKYGGGGYGEMYTFIK